MLYISITHAEYENSGNNNGQGSNQYGVPDCIHIKHIVFNYHREWWVNYAINTSALTLARHCYSCCLTTCTFTTATTLKLVVDSVVLHQMCNNCSSLLIFKQLLVLTEIQLSDISSGTTIQYICAKLIQYYKSKCFFEITVYFFHICHFIEYGQVYNYIIE